MSKITVEDVVNMDARSLIAKMGVKDEVTKVDEVAATPSKFVPEAFPLQPTDTFEEPSQVAPQPEKVAISDGDFTTFTKFNKKLLKGMFLENTTFVKGQVIDLGLDGRLEILAVENSSGRIKFQVASTGEIFSQAAAVLTGKGDKEQLPYKKGDLVSFEGNTLEVIGLNPANRNVVVMLNGQKRYLKISKVTPVAA